MNEVQPIREKRQINAIKKALRGRDLLLFTLGINSGLRISDILALKVGDVRGKAMEIIAKARDQITEEDIEFLRKNYTSAGGFDSMYSMSSTPLTSCSIGVATVSAITCGVAPG